MSERDGCVVVKNSKLVIEGKRDTETGKPNERGQCRPAMGRNDRQAAGAPQVVGQ